MIMKYKLAIILSGIGTGLIGVLVKLIGNTIPPMTLNFTRLLIGLVTVTLMVPFLEKDLLKVTKKELKSYAIVGVLMAIAFSMFVIANLLAPVSNVSLITSTYVIFTAILALVFLKENITIYHIIAMIVATAGIIIINPFVLEKALGNYIALAQALVFAGVVVYTRKVEKHFHYKSIFWFFLFATIFLAPFGIYYGFTGISSVLIYLIPLGAFSTGIGYFLFAYGIQKVDAETSALLTLAVFPPSSIVFAYLFIGEPIDLKIIIGAALLLIAGAIAIKKCKIKKHALCH